MSIFPRNKQLGMHKADVFALLSGVVGFAGLASSSAYQNQLTALLGHNAPQGAAVIGLVGAAASVASRVLSNPTTPSTIAQSPVVESVERAIQPKELIMSNGLLKSILALIFAELVSHPLRVGDYQVSVSPYVHPAGPNPGV